MDAWRSVQGLLWATMSSPTSAVVTRFVAWRCSVPLSATASGTTGRGVLVEFRPGHVPGLLAIAGMELELGGLLGREVELRTYEDLSRRFRDRVRVSARELYAAD